MRIKQRNEIAGGWSIKMQTTTASHVNQNNGNDGAATEEHFLTHHRYPRVTIPGWDVRVAAGSSNQLSSCPLSHPRVTQSPTTTRATKEPLFVVKVVLTTRALLLCSGRIIKLDIYVSGILVLNHPHHHDHPPPSITRGA